MQPPFLQGMNKNVLFINSWFPPDIQRSIYPSIVHFQSLPRWVCACFVVLFVGLVEIGKLRQKTENFGGEKCGIWRRKRVLICWRTRPPILQDWRMWLRIRKEGRSIWLRLGVPLMAVMCGGTFVKSLCFPMVSFFFNMWNLFLSSGFELCWVSELLLWLVVLILMWLCIEFLCLLIVNLVYPCEILCRFVDFEHGRLVRW